MKCPQCGGMSRVLETRDRVEGAELYRSRECRNKHRFYTREFVFNEAQGQGKSVYLDRTQLAVRLARAKNALQKAEGELRHAILDAGLTGRRGNTRRRRVGSAAGSPVRAGSQPQSDGG